MFHSKYVCVETECRLENLPRVVANRDRKRERAKGFRVAIKKNLRIMCQMC